MSDQYDSTQSATRAGSVLRAIGGFVTYVVLLIISVTLILLFLRGGLWLASKLLPIIDFLAEVGSIALVLLLLAAIVSKWRSAAGRGIVIVALVWTLDLWLWSILTLVDLWGGFAMFLGIVLTPLAAIPLSLIALVFHREFGIFFVTLVAVVLTIAAYVFGNWLSESAARRAPADMSI